MPKSSSVYTQSLLQTKVVLSIIEIGKNLNDYLQQKIERKVGGKCIVDGYVQPKSIDLVSHSSGNILGETVEFQCVYRCNVCLPLEGMEIECVCKTLTKAGIHAQVVDEHGNIPVVVFVAREHHDNHPAFQSESGVKEGDTLTVCILGERFELNEDCICTIATLVSRNNNEDAVDI